MKNHSDEANERNGVLQNQVLPVNPFVVVVVVFFFNGLRNQGLAAQIVATVGKSSFEGRERRRKRVRQTLETER